MMVRTTSEVARRRRFTVDELTRMVEAGVFRDEERFELIDGEVVEVPQPGPRHCGHVNRLTWLFSARCGDRCVVQVQNPLHLDRHNLFLPDLLLLRSREDFYADHYPRPEETLLAIEVADTSLSRDRRLKLPIYARLGVPRLWILDLRRRCLHAYEDLREGEYRSHRRCAGEERLSIPEDGDVRVGDLLCS